MPPDSLLTYPNAGVLGRLAPVDSAGQLITDGGPVYTETDLHHLVAEPFNALSAVIFIFISAYWMWKLRKDFLQHTFLSIANVMLMVGGIGGSVYHAFRQSSAFLLMDWLPILLICLAASAFYFRKAAGSWRPALVTLVVCILIEAINFIWTPVTIAVNVSYAVMGLMVLLPTLLILWRTGFQHGHWVAIALVAFVLALVFRLADTGSSWTMGTHFLWHVFGAVACHTMFLYTYRLYGVEVLIPAVKRA